MFALFGSLAPLELGLVLIAAIMIFGRDLPRVAAQLFAQLAKVKRSMRDMWRETGMEEEMRRVRNELDDVKHSIPSVETLDPRTKARELARDLDVKVREIPEGPSESPSSKRPATKDTTSKRTEDEDAAEGQAATPPLSQEELRRQADEAEAKASRRAAEAQARMRARGNPPAEPEGEAERRA